LSGGLGKDDQHLHHPWLDVGGTPRTRDRPARWADSREAEGEVRARGKLCRCQQPVSRNPNRIVHRRCPQIIGKSSAIRQIIIIPPDRGLGNLCDDRNEGGCHAWPDKGGRDVIDRSHAKG
jgi:hypothetical protein